MWILIGVMFVVTFGLRAAPFVVKSWFTDNEILEALGRLMPAGIMVILVVYSFTDVLNRGIIPAVAGVVATAVLHLWRSNMMVSIIGGVITYGVVLALV